MTIIGVSWWSVSHISAKSKSAFSPYHRMHGDRVEDGSHAVDSIARGRSEALSMVVIHFIVGFVFVVVVVVFCLN